MEHDLYKLEQRNSPGEEKDHPFRDLVVASVVTIVVTLVMMQFDLFEKFHELTREEEDWNLDEIALGVFVLTLNLGWFALRRWRSASREVKRRMELEEELKAAYRGELVITARKAGMAEVSTGVLHNVGNVLNSIGVNAESMRKTIKNSRVTYLNNVAKTMEEHADDIGPFLQSDEKGKLLPGFISQLSQSLDREREHLINTVEKLTGYVHHISEIINLQHSYSKTGGIAEPALLSELVEDSLRINSEGLNRHHITVKRDYAQLPPAVFDRARVLQIMTNLVNNAKYALSKGEREEKNLTLVIGKPVDGRVQIRVMDNGIGIPKKNLERIFEYGFTTHKDGNGYGLHNSLAAATELGGSLRVESGGVGKGAEFTLELPFKRGDKNEK
ncbi:MAG: hypothetical protein GY940_45865 [bacterium]|nr:hypothetical protein [bacterium]